MEIEIGYDKTQQKVIVPDKNLVGVLEPNAIEVVTKGASLVVEALQNPIGARKLSELILPDQKVVIITSDVTRPVPSYKIIPAILEEIEKAGVKYENISVVFALGNHRKQTPEEMKKLVSEKIYNKIRCVDGNSADYIHMGTTKLGTPVDITRIVAEADFRIGVGNIEYHYFAGYSGGAKAIMPGVSTRDAIQSNHSRMVFPEAAAGKLDGNPVREDIEEAIKYCHLHYIVNVVLDEHKEIVYAVAGDYIKAHREGCRFLDTLYRKPITERADIVITSQGGAPKDLTLYQTQKALDNAKYAVKDGGVIILVGSCKEGLGEDVFEDWLLKAEKPNDLVERIKQDFQLGGHKAAAIAMVLEDADIYLVSEMESAFVERLFMRPFSTVQGALDAAFLKLGAGASVLVMPYGGSTLPAADNS
jgi:nickel-dependent lactate racemase